MPSPQLQTLLGAIRAAPSRADLTLQQLRQQLEDQARLAPVAGDVRCRPVDADGVPAEWVLAPGIGAAAAGGGSVVLYLHGGGYYRGSLNTHRELCSRISRAAGVAVLNVGYRLAPEHPFPAALEDALAAYRWLVGTGIAPHRIIAAGDSAGGGLAAALMLSLRGQGEPLPGGGVLLSPWTDLAQTGPSIQSRAAADPSLTKAYLDRFAQAYLGAADARDPLASPWYADLRGLPPLLIQVGTAEILEDDAARFAAKAEAAGVTVRLERWPDMIHVWQRYAVMLPEAQEAIERIGAWVRERGN
jgi:acetyl esterase/lipase